MSATVLRENTPFEGQTMSPREIRLAREAFFAGMANDFVPITERREYVAERYPLPRTSKPREEVDTAGDSWKWEKGRLWWRDQTDTEKEWRTHVPIMNDGNREAISKVLADPVVYVEVSEFPVLPESRGEGQ